MNEPGPALRRPFRLGIGLGLALLGHAIGWILFFLLGFEDDSPAIPAWATLVLHVGGREGVRGVFVLAATLWAYVGMVEHADEGRTRVARTIGLGAALLVALFGWSWVRSGHSVLGTLGTLLVVPGVLGPPRVKVK